MSTPAHLITRANHLAAATANFRSVKLQASFRSLKTWSYIDSAVFAMTATYKRSWMHNVHNSFVWKIAITTDSETSYGESCPLNLFNSYARITGPRQRMRRYKATARQFQVQETVM